MSEVSPLLLEVDNADEKLQQTAKLPYNLYIAVVTPPPASSAHGVEIERLFLVSGATEDDELEWMSARLLCRSDLHLGRGHSSRMAHDRPQGWYWMYALMVQPMVIGRLFIGRVDITQLGHLATFLVMPDLRSVAETLGIPPHIYAIEELTRLGHLRMEDTLDLVKIAPTLDKFVKDIQRGVKYGPLGGDPMHPPTIQVPRRTP